ncbi:hypothetical protein KHM83_04195 [Fusibacter paucivorans]|uniref:DUF5667 domain-containing protein n=1 Tax=Fusibacter paucivorans TaxID=76009 RepID=A0ABS5PNF1_9FIRM|nr:hypothetical protein [Fusibacter paucivorans]MBS7525876.1 hypothetical protein [Fusibacter paucivorans]
MWKRVMVSLLIFVAMISYTTIKIHKINALTYADQDLKTIMETTTASVNDILLQNSEEPAIDKVANPLKSSASSPVDASDELSMAGSDPVENAESADIHTTEPAPQETVTPQDDTAHVASEMPQTISKREDALTARGDAVRMTYDAICSDYRLRMTSLENASEKALDDLVENAKTEYLMAEESERHTLEFKGRMAAKYFELAKNLEEMVDQAVVAALGDFRKSLESNGFETQVVDDMATTYEKTKTIKRNEILSEIMLKTQDTM